VKAAPNFEAADFLLRNGVQFLLFSADKLLVYQYFREVTKKLDQIIAQVQ
jgi:hypothetical protein